jgi:hypothetical protein
MMGRSRHLHDDRLHDCYLAARCGEALDPRAADHIADCDSCAARYRELADLLGTVGRQAELDADDIFTPERLQHQRDAVLRRLEFAGRPARVISFPGHGAVPVHRTRMATRWLAAAAAAGLFVGVAVGGAFLPARGAQNGTRFPVQPPAALAVAAPRRVSTPAAATETVDDDRFLHELEIALERPNTRELLSFDHLTPHVREIGSRVR